jgi:hypothetical protein
MSPVAENMLLKQQCAEYEQMLKQMTLQNFKLKQEVTGGLQVIWHLANSTDEKKLVIPADDLVTSAGRVQRMHDAESNTYTFIALPPETEEERKARIEAKIAAAKEASKPQIQIVTEGPSEVQ